MRPTRRPNRRAAMKIILSIIMPMAVLAARAQTPSPESQDSEAKRLEHVQALHDPMIPGDVPTYYTPGNENHARDLQRFLAGERAFYRKELSVDVPLSLAVLDHRQWDQVTKVYPYPVPSLEGDPPVALMPLDWADAAPLSSKEDIDPALLQAVKARGEDWTQ